MTKLAKAVVLEAEQATPVVLLLLVPLLLLQVRAYWLLLFALPQVKVQAIMLTWQVLTCQQAQASGCWVLLLQGWTGPPPLTQDRAGMHTHGRRVKRI